MKRFNVRVYGIVRNHHGMLLLTDEFRMGVHMTKFPGGGLEWGEGIRDALIREFMEETGQEVTVGNHIYVNDFLQISAFRPDDQVISMYYEVLLPDPGSIEHDDTFRFRSDVADGAQAFRWVNPDVITEDDLTFPIDKVVLRRIKGSA